MEDLQSKLFVSESGKYGDKYIEHLLEQYKIYVASADKISDRRLKTNEFFLALNSALVTLLGFISAHTAKADAIALLFMASLAGIAMCYFWYRMVRSYDGLNSGKFRVIHAIESRLPLALYDTEWETLGRGNSRKTYWPFTHLERRVPWVFITLYLFLLAISLPWTEFYQAAASLLNLHR